MIVKPIEVRLNICIHYNNSNLVIQGKDSTNSQKDGDANGGGDKSNNQPHEGGSKGNDVGSGGDGDGKGNDDGDGSNKDNDNDRRDDSDDDGSSSRKSGETKSSGKRKNNGNGKKRLQKSQSYHVVPLWYLL